MSTRTCEKCGWVVDSRDPSYDCPICKTRFKTGICRICKKQVEFYRNRLVCKTCYDTVTRKPDASLRVKQRRQQIYKEWRAKIAKVPKTYPTLTEQQWLEACKYFDGCAVCGAESIDARGYFVTFAEGGRYCDWNILPMCERCATAARTQPNMFLSTDPRVRKSLTNIINYLEDKLDAAGKD